MPAMSVMRRLPVLILLAVLPSCGSFGPSFVAPYEPWRKEVETQCLYSGAVQETPYRLGRGPLEGPSQCGAVNAFFVKAVDRGSVALEPAATLRCPMIPALEAWVREVVQPAAMRAYGHPVVALKVAASYGCRARNHVHGARLSEHGYANAIDIAAVTFADGTKWVLKPGWQGSEAERWFWRTLHRGGCEHFTTVLGPDHDRLHEDHFHLDLARHGKDGRRRICK